MTALPGACLLSLIFVVVLYCILISASKTLWHKIDCSQDPDESRTRCAARVNEI
jgi:hypothetical protein